MNAFLMVAAPVPRVFRVERSYFCTHWSPYLSSRRIAVGAP